MKTPTSGKFCYDVEPQDLIKYGLIPEFVAGCRWSRPLEELDEKRTGTDFDRAEKCTDQTVREAV